MRRLLPLALLALALGLSACGGGSSAGSTGTVAETGAAESAQSLVAAAGARSGDTGSARISFTATFSGGTTGTMSGEGAFSERRGRMTLDLSGLGGGSPIPGGQAELVFDRLVFYLKLPENAGLPLPPGKEWFKLDLAKLGETSGLDLRQLLQLDQSDPSQALDFLQGASEDFHEVGRETVRGEETTRYAGTVDLDKVAANAPAEVAEQYRKLAELSASKEIPMDVWIGSDGRVRKVAFTQKVTPSSSIRMEEEIYDYGTDVDVSPPPAASVVDLTDLIGQS